MQIRPKGTPNPRPVPAGAGADLRWVSPAIAAAAFEIRDLAPGLTSLLYVETLPDATIQTILDWSEEVALPGAGGAFALDRLRTVLPALLTAYLGAHTYSQADPGEDGGRCVDLHDQGCGALVGAVMARLELIAAALHADEGRRLVAEARSSSGGPSRSDRRSGDGEVNAGRRRISGAALERPREPAVARDVVRGDMPAKPVLRRSDAPPDRPDRMPGPETGI